jgi:hypothetical protein
MSPLIFWLFFFYFQTKPSSSPPVSGFQQALSATSVQISGMSEYLFNLENINKILPKKFFCSTTDEFGSRKQGQ